MKRQGRGVPEGEAARKAARPGSLKELTTARITAHGAGPGDSRRIALHDFLPDEKLREVANLYDFASMPVSDKWTCHTNGRQTIFEEAAPPALKNY